MGDYGSYDHYDVAVAVYLRDVARRAKMAADGGMTYTDAISLVILGDIMK